MNGTEKVRPSSWYYLVAAAFFAGGIGLMAYFLVADVHRIRESMVRMEVPGELTLELKRNQTYTLFIEHAAWSKTDGASLAALATVSCDVHNDLTGELIHPNDKVTSASYNYAGRSGVSMLDVEILRDGTYTIACQGPSQIAGDKIQVAVGGGAGKAIGAVLGKSLLTLIGGIVIGALILARVLMLRLESRRDILDRGLRPV